MGAAVANGIRVTTLLALLIVLPVSTGWITALVLTGIVVVLSGLCCLAACCCCDPCDCDPCSGCDCGCPDDCCGDCDCDCDCGCDGCCDGCDCDCGCSTLDGPETALALPLVAWGLPRARAAALDRRLAHHPATAAYEQDVYRLGPWRLCIGCTTVYPVFLAASLVLAMGPPAWPPSVWIGLGVPLALLQVLSAAGWARRRWQKASIKTALGLGLAAIFHAVLISTLSPAVQTVVLVGVLAVAFASAVPRALRMRCEHVQ